VHLVPARPTPNSGVARGDYPYWNCSTVRETGLWNVHNGLRALQDTWLQLAVPGHGVTINAHLRLVRKVGNRLQYERIDVKGVVDAALLVHSGLNRLVRDIVARYYQGVNMADMKVRYHMFHVYQVGTGRYLGNLKTLRINCCARNAWSIGH
jgi:hypothetical protein